MARGKGDELLLLNGIVLKAVDDLGLQMVAHG